MCDALGGGFEASPSYSRTAELGQYGRCEWQRAAHVNISCSWRDLRILNGVPRCSVHTFAPELRRREAKAARRRSSACQTYSVCAVESPEAVTWHMLPAKRFRAYWQIMIRTPYRVLLHTHQHPCMQTVCKPQRAAPTCPMCPICPAPCTRRSSWMGCEEWACTTMRPSQPCPTCPGYLAACDSLCRLCWRTGSTPASTSEWMGPQCVGVRGTRSW